MVSVRVTCDPANTRLIIDVSMTSYPHWTWGCTLKKPDAQWVIRLYSTTWIQ